MIRNKERESVEDTHIAPHQRNYHMVSSLLLWFHTAPCILDLIQASPQPDEGRFYCMSSFCSGENWSLQSFCDFAKITKLVVEWLWFQSSYTYYFPLQILPPCDTDFLVRQQKTFWSIKRSVIGSIGRSTLWSRKMMFTLSMVRVVLCLQHVKKIWVRIKILLLRVEQNTTVHIILSQAITYCNLTSIRLKTLRTANNTSFYILKINECQERDQLSQS